MASTTTTRSSSVVLFLATVILCSVLLEHGHYGTVAAFGIVSPMTGSGSSMISSSSLSSSSSSFRSTDRMIHTRLSGVGLSSPIWIPRLYFGGSRGNNNNNRQRHGKTVLYRIRCENKYYQLEEMEDRENCTTELFLKEDGQVLIGETDGPLWTDAIGTWQIRHGTDDFTMNIRRKFKSGNDGSDMGEFEYELERTYIGDMTAVGESVAVTGVMHSTDVLSGEDQEVGFFNMIDGTDVREDKRTDARPGTGVAGKPVKDEATTHKGADFLSSFNDNSYTSTGASYDNGMTSNGFQDNSGYGGAPSYTTGYDNGYQQQPQQQPAQQYENTYASFGGNNNGFYNTDNQSSQQQNSYDPGPPSFADYAYGGQQQQQPQQQQSYESEYDRQYQAQYNGQQQQYQPQQGQYEQQQGYGDNWQNESYNPPADQTNYQDNWPRYQ